MRALSVSSPPAIRGVFTLFLRLVLFSRRDHGVLAFLCDFPVFLQKPTLPQGQAVFLLAAQMVIHLALQFFTDGFPQLADIAVRLPTNGSKPGGAVEPQRENIGLPCVPH